MTAPAERMRVLGKDGGWREGGRRGLGGRGGRRESE
jgi:hypothetical protein